MNLTLDNVNPLSKIIGGRRNKKKNVESKDTTDFKNVNSVDLQTRSWLMSATNRINKPVRAPITIVAPASGITWMFNCFKI